jgi:MFS family permease
VIWAAAGAGVVLLAAYVLHARRAAHPVLQLGLFRTRTFNVSVVGGFITRLGVGGMPFLLPLLYQVGLGYPPWLAGLLTVPQACAAIGMRIISRVILARYGHRRVLAVNTILLGCNIMMFSLVGAGTPIVAILALGLMQGFFSSLQFSSINSITYADIDNRDASKASSIASTMQQMALSFGVASSALVAGFFLSHIPQAQSVAFIGGLHKTFLALGGFTILSSLIFRSLREADGANVSHYAPRALRAEIPNPEIPNSK